MPDHLDQLPTDAVDFFCIFARFEFALKASGYFRKAPGGHAEANWKKYGKQVGISQLFEELRKNQTVRYIIDNPPKTQVVVRRDGKDEIDWEQRNAVPVTDVPGLIEAIKRTRNNLFHGGKTFAGEFIERPERNHKLIKAATVILKCMLDVTTDVKERYYSKDV